MITPDRRRLLASLGGYTSWANTVDRTKRTAPGRAALLRKFEAEANLTDDMSAEERDRRVAEVRAAFYIRVSAARREKAAARRAAKILAECGVDPDGLVARSEQT